MQFSALNTLAFVEAPPERMTAASTLLSTVQQINAALGVAVAALANKLSGLIRGGGPVDLLDLHVAFGVVALVCLPAVLYALRLDPRLRTGAAATP